jgi:hypothetical protein
MSAAGTDAPMNTDPPADEEFSPESMSPFESRRTTIIVLWSTYVVAAVILTLYWIYSV